MESLALSSVVWLPYSLIVGKETGPRQAPTTVHTELVSSTGAKLRYSFHFVSIVCDCSDSSGIWCGMAACSGQRGGGCVVRTVDWCSVTACSGQGGGPTVRGGGNTLHSFVISYLLTENCHQQMLETKKVNFCKIKIKHFINLCATIAPLKS